LCARAEQFLLVQVSPQGTTYIMPSHSNVGGNSPSLAVTIVFPTPQDLHVQAKADFAAARYELDCSEHKLRTNQAAFFDKAGNKVFEDDATGVWETITQSEDSPRSRMEKYACAADASKLRSVEAPSAGALIARTLDLLSGKGSDLSPP